MNKKRLLSFMSAAVLSLGLLAGCQNSNSVSNNSANTETVVIKDTNGEVTVPLNPERVVVLDYGALDILNTLNVEVIGLPKAELPSYLDEYKDNKYTDVGSLKEVNMEKINELNPDLIIIEGRQADSYEELSKIAPTVYLNNSGSDFVGSVKNSAETYAKIFGKEDEVADKITEIDARIKNIHDKVTTNSYDGLVTMITDGSMSVYGAGSRYGIIFNELGFKPTDENIKVSQHGQSISFEYLAEKNPGYLFVIDKGDITGTGTPAKTTLENELVKTTDTYKNGNIVYLNSKAWYVGGYGFEALDIMLSDIEGAINK